jgi:23S rRNA (cytidine1920-2'-O)/16S rRNA (cytidine1409-2'-O)-methyltransferase
MVLAGDVELSGSKVAGRPTAGMFVATDTEIIVRRGPRFVSRGGEKLAHALAAFNVDPSGMVALDIGASTGGFTDCLLQAGARKVYAVDVGRGQLHAVLAADRRVVSMERLNARNSFQLPEPVDLVVVDVSFISLRLVLGPSLAHVTHGGKAIVLVKPQFEAEPEEVGRKGVITDPGVHAAVIGRVVRWCVERGIRVRRLTASPILGDEGNREFLLLLQPEPV